MENIEKQDENKSENTKIPKTILLKDAIMSGIILILILVVIVLTNVILITKTIDAKDIIDQVSFTAGITSIFLAIVAIVYAFFQSRETSAQNKQVHEGLNKINVRIAQFTSIKDDFNVMRKVLETQSDNITGAVSDVKGVIDVIQEYSEQMKGKENVPEDLNERLSEITKKLNEIESSNNSSYSFSDKYSSLLDYRSGELNPSAFDSVRSSVLNPLKRSFIKTTEEIKDNN